MNQRGSVLTILVVIVLILLMGSVAFYFGTRYQITPRAVDQTVKQTYSQPSPSSNTSEMSNETAQWKTYTDSKSNYSFKYPNTYFKYFQAQDDDAYLAPTEGTGAEAGTPLALNQNDVWININLLPTSSVNNFKSLEEWVKSQQSSSEGKPPTMETTILGGEKGYTLYFDSPQGPQAVYSYQTTTHKGENLYQVNMFAFRNDALVAKKNIYNEIISSFKFSQ